MQLYLILYMRGSTYFGDNHSIYILPTIHSVQNSLMSFLCCLAEDEYNWVSLGPYVHLLIVVDYSPNTWQLQVNDESINLQVLRVQSPSGRFVVDGLTQDSSLWTLQKFIEEKTAIHPDRQRSMCTVYGLFFLSLCVVV